MDTLEICGDILQPWGQLENPWSCLQWKKTITLEAGNLNINLAIVDEI